MAVAALMHESNSFNPAPTTLADFKVELPAPGTDLIATWAKNMNEVAGFIARSQNDFTLVPLLYANATPKGAVTREAFETLTGHLLAGLKKAAPLDGVYLALHGALYSEAYPQGDEEIVRRVRALIGPDVPLAVTHDFHANVSPEMPKYVNALVVYKMNPHLDTKERGMQAADILRRTLRKEVKPVTVVVKPPMIYNIVFQHTESEPLQPIKQASIDLEKSNPKVLAASVSGRVSVQRLRVDGPGGDGGDGQRSGAGPAGGAAAGRSDVGHARPHPAAVAGCSHGGARRDGGHEVPGGAVRHRGQHRRRLGGRQHVPAGGTGEAEGAGLGGSAGRPGRGGCRQARGHWRRVRHAGGRQDGPGARRAGTDPRRGEIPASGAVH